MPCYISFSGDSCPQRHFMLLRSSRRGRPFQLPRSGTMGPAFCFQVCFPSWLSFAFRRAGARNLRPLAASANTRSCLQNTFHERLCGLVVGVLATDTEVPALRHFLRSIGSATGPLGLKSKIEEVLGRTSNGSGLENQE
jgi:hypothetical protein